MCLKALSYLASTLGAIVSVSHWFAQGGSYLVAAWAAVAAVAHPFVWSHLGKMVRDRGGWPRLVLMGSFLTAVTVFNLLTAWAAIEGVFRVQSMSEAQVREEVVAKVEARRTELATLVAAVTAAVTSRDHAVTTLPPEVPAGPPPSALQEARDKAKEAVETTEAIRKKAEEHVSSAYGSKVFSASSAASARLDQVTRDAETARSTLAAVDAQIVAAAAAVTAREARTAALARIEALEQGVNRARAAHATAAAVPAPVVPEVTLMESATTRRWMAMFLAVLMEAFIALVALTGPTPLPHQECPPPPVPPVRIAFPTPAGLDGGGGISLALPAPRTVVSETIETTTQRIERTVEVEEPELLRYFRDRLAGWPGGNKPLPGRRALGPKWAVRRIPQLDQDLVAHGLLRIEGQATWLQRDHGSYEAACAWAASVITREHAVTT